MILNKKMIDKLQQLKEEGYSILEIAQQIGVSTRVVANAIKKKNKSSSIKKKTWTKETIDRLKQLKEEGLSMSEIAKKLGVSKNTIAGKLYRLKKNNLSPILKENKTEVIDTEMNELDHSVKLKGLFDNRDVEYIGVGNRNTTSVMKQIHSYASKNFIKVKTKIGVFTNPDTLEQERVVRCEVVERNKDYVKYSRGEKTKILQKERKERKIQRNKELRKRNLEIYNLHEKGMSMQDIANKFNLCRQQVSAILIKVKENKEE